MRKRYHSITDIVATVYCEQKAVYDRERGDARPLDVRIKAATGTFEHLRFRVEGQTSQIVDKRCFIASQVYGGEAWQTNTLRAWRDRVLMPRATGRVAVRLYYAVSPGIARVLERWPRAAGLVRRALDRLVVFVEGR